MNQLPFSEAAERNSQAILEQVQELFPGTGTVLEVGSGTGQHAVFIARHLTDLCWQPTDRHENLAGLKARFDAEKNERILKPLELDVLVNPWPAQIYDAAFSANTAHIMPWEAVQAMFAGVATHLVRDACFCLYGPFNINGGFTSPSNAQFDAHLRAGVPHMGIRDMARLESLANKHQLDLEQKIVMPANNFILVFVKKASGFFSHPVL